MQDLSENRQRSRSGSRDRSKARALRSSPSPMLEQASSSASPPPPLPPRKHAICPTQAKCLRSIFAALLWHEGNNRDKPSSVQALSLSLSKCLSISWLVSSVNFCRSYLKRNIYSTQYSCISWYSVATIFFFV